jgi:cysteine synthase B
MMRLWPTTPSRFPPKTPTKLPKRLAQEKGLFVGPSSGAPLVAAMRVAEEAERAVVVTVFPDGGEGYLSEGPWRKG